MAVFSNYCLSHRYKSDKNALVVTVVQCQELPARDPNVGSSDPYVKLQLLPDKQHKVKTRVLRKTRNPVYDEDFTFYGISFNQLQVKIAEITDKFLKMNKGREPNQQCVFHGSNAHQ